jgi:hypothetical protein
MDRVTVAMTADDDDFEAREAKTRARLLDQAERALRRGQEHDFTA